MPAVLTIDGARKVRGNAIPRGACRCVTNPRTHRSVQICKGLDGKTHIKGKCAREGAI